MLFDLMKKIQKSLMTLFHREGFIIPKNLIVLLDIIHWLRTQAEKMLHNVQLKTNFGSGMKMWGRSAPA